MNVQDVRTSAGPLLMQRSDSIAVLTLDQPERRNALSEAMLASLSNALTDIAADTSVRAVLVVTHSDGSVQHLATSTGWQVHAGPVTSANRYYGETYDARIAQPGWDTPTFVATGWTPATAAGPSVDAPMVAEVRPPMRAWDRAAVSVTDQGADGWLVIRVSWRMAMTEPERLHRLLERAVVLRSRCGTCAAA